jgi:tetratricopeptide (TPR) repeat protein
MKMVKYISILCLLFTGVDTLGQNYTGQAYGFYQDKNYDSAMFYIDKAVISNEKNNSKTWQLRGVIYRNMDAKGSLKFREIAISSFVMARELDSLDKYSKEIGNYLYNINIRYYNDAVEYLQEGLLEESESSYLKYKKNFNEILLKEHDFTDQDIEYYCVLGGAWFKKNTQVDAAEKLMIYSSSIVAFKKALVLDSLNYSANYGIGISYYNQGADLITNLNPFESNLDEIDEIQNKSITMFKMGEPYLKRAFKINPNEKEVVEGLTGIYYSLNEDEEYNYFKNLLDKMEE